MSAQKKSTKASVWMMVQKKFHHVKLFDEVRILMFARVTTPRYTN